MFDRDFFSRSLKIHLRSLAILPDRYFCEHALNWSRIKANLFGVEDMRARLGPFETPWAADSRFPIPDLESIPAGPLHAIMDDRACEIAAVARARDKQIVVMWSGGIDSTAVLASLIRNLSPNDLKRVIVCTTTAGICENPFFYSSQIANRFEIMHWYDLLIDNEFLCNHILLHGDPGDCIFGPSVAKFKSLWADRQYLLSWRDNRDVLYRLYHDDRRPDFDQWWVDKVCNNLEAVQSQGKMGRIVSIGDWHWWNYYNLKWQSSMTRCIEKNKRRAKDVIDPVLLDEFFDLTFFASSKFQAWSYQNIHDLIGPDISLHKSQIKNYIYSVDGHTDYRINKMKTVSDVYHCNSVVAIGHDGVHYDFGDDGFASAFLALLAGSEN